MTRNVLLSLILLLLFVPSLGAQTEVTPAPAKPAPDVLIFANGDQLTGKLQRIVGGNVVFTSDMAGELTISVDKVKELRSGAQFAVVRKGDVPGKVKEPQGAVAIADGNLTLTPAAGETGATVPTKSVDYLIDKATFDKQVSRKAGFRDGWNGSVTGGATLVRSTETGTTLTASLNLIRAIPTVSWMPARNRTTVNVAESYGRLSTPLIPPPTPPTPNTPTVVLTSIFHADGERDQYFTSRLYALADTSFDHNYAQGLQLQQIYGGGIGWTPIKSDKQELDLKVDVHYEEQAFITTAVNGAVVATTPNLNLIGSTIFEGYRWNLPRKMVFTETANILPAWNDSNAYSANGTATFLLPVFKRLSASISTTDNFLNDPAPFYRKNSYQFVTGVTYLFR